MNIHISELIKKLQDIKSSYGDLEVYALKSAFPARCPLPMPLHMSIGYMDNEGEVDQAAEEGKTKKYKEWRILELAPYDTDDDC